jgi:DNA-binding transcriptional LysR family regulator
MRFKGFDLNLLVALDALLTERSVSRAAARLNLTQPAASAALSRLRASFNDEILVLSGKRMLPTAHAESLAPVLQDVLRGIEQLISASTVFEPAASNRRFRICASDYITTVLLTPLLADIERQAPGVSIQVVQPSPRVIQLFEQGVLDLMLVPEDYLAPEHPAELLFEERHVVVGWAGNPALSGALSQETFFALGHVSVELAEQASTFAEAQLRKLGYARRIEVVAPFFSAVPWMLPGTMRLAIMHERLAGMLTPGLPLKVMPLPFPFAPMKEMIQYHRSRAFDGGLEWLLGLIRARASTQRSS